MLTQIFLHTPKWVFVLFAALVWLGAKQLFANSVGLGRVTVMPIVMTGLSIFGVTSAFGDSPTALLAWAATALVALTLVLQRGLPASTRYAPASRTFHLAGSAVPLALMMGIFFTKYAVGATLAMHPEIRHDATFALAVPLMYGFFSGVFAGRALRLWKLALREDRALYNVGGA
ncbi:hypothetical protein QTI17_26120 [Variovorax sp. J31P179]|uniref:DUF6622 family protein n=1 Tax=Variovorax sp. J31P179 TaxID=3053508 RepID=UPI00257848A9|nr:DUF6622 family protein [Variovorax sp. J31P179]MDM0084082.1 hypothetical protein [Variovorax sp. J31P179]HET7835310.1 DUF6622 family protein [Variovorax sp.]